MRASSNRRHRHLRPPHLGVLAFLLASLSSTLSLIAAAPTDETERPNFIFILAEDMGFGDLACYGHPYARTPNLDRLAAEGTRWVRFYVTGATCNPSRTGLMTSRHPASFPNYMDDFGLQNATTITDLLHENGYATGHFGKWHLGLENDPEQGTYGVQDIRIRARSHNDPMGKDAIIFSDALEFIENHRDEPFYLNIWGHIAHSPVEPNPRLVQEFCDVTVDRNDFGYWDQRMFDRVSKLGGDIDDGMRHYLADIWALDVQVGLVMDKLRELDLERKTVVIFTSDHGQAPPDPDQQSYPVRMMGLSHGLRGHKHTFYEGGLRVPYIVRYPGHVPAGKVNHKSIISGFDLLPTVANIAKVDYDPAMFEGEDMSDVWFGSDRVRSTPLFWRYSRTDGVRALLFGKWKLHVNKKDEASLYDLEADREERFNLAEVENATSVALQETLREWEKTLPKNYCRLDERYEPCRKGIPLPFSATIPPSKMGPPEKVSYEIVSYESAALLAPRTVVDASSAPQDAQKLDYEAKSIELCLDYTPPTHIPTMSPMPTMISASMPVSTSADISGDGVLLESLGEEDEINDISGTKEGDKAPINGNILGNTSTDLASDENMLGGATATSPAPFLQSEIIYSIIFAGLCLLLVVI